MSNIFLSDFSDIYMYISMLIYDISSINLSYINNVSYIWLIIQYICHIHLTSINNLEELFAGGGGVGEVKTIKKI